MCKLKRERCREKDQVSERYGELRKALLTGFSTLPVQK